MARFLVVATTVQPLPGDADLSAAAAHWRDLVRNKDAEAFVIDGDGGFIVLLDVDDHEELMEILMSNPMNRWGEFEVIPMISAEAEERILERAGAI